MTVKKRPLIIGIAAGLAFAALAAFVYVRSHSGSSLSVIRVSGNIEVTDAEVSFKIPGRVITRLVTEGQTIQAGQIVAQLDRTELAQEIALRGAEMEAARATLAELEAGFRSEEVAEAEAAVRRLEADRDRLLSDFERQKTLLAREVISSREFESSQAALRMAEGALQEAEERLRLLRKGPRQETIDAARARLEQTRQAVGLAETRLGYATLVSPLSGFVLSEHVEAGEYVSAGTPVVTVGDVEHPWLRAYIDETDLGRVMLGQRVRLTTDTYPGKIYQGHVSFISSAAEFTPKNVQTEKERVKLVYRIKVEASNPDLELKPGMPADAEILLNGNEQ